MDHRILRSIYPGSEYDEPGYLYDTQGCGCCSTTMQPLTLDLLKAHIAGLEKELKEAQALLEKIPE